MLDVEFAVFNLEFPLTIYFRIYHGSASKIW